jgi:hypothetical protein
LDVFVRWLKSGSFGFAKRWLLCIGQNQMCHLCGWLKLFLKNVQWEKKYNTKRWAVVSEKSPLLSLYVVLMFR